MPGLRILLVEDNPDLRQLLREVLHNLSASIVETAGGTPMLQALAAEGPFDLIVADVRNSGSDGLRSLSLARAVGMETPFLVLTAFGDPDMRARVAELGRSEPIEKPFDTQELLQRVRRLVRVSAETPVGPGGDDG